MGKVHVDQSGYSEKELAMLKRYMPLVRKVVSRVAGKVSQDLLDAAMFGLLDAVHRYDPGQGTNFATYARFRVRGAVIDRMREQDVLGRTQRHKVTLLAKAIDHLERRFGRPPEAIEVAQELKISLEELGELWALLEPTTLSVEEWEGEPAEDHDDSENRVPETPGGRVRDVLDLGDEDPLARLMQAENSRTIETMLSQLPERERECIILSFYDNLTLKEVGERLGFTESRASQIRTRGLGMLRKMMHRYQ